MGPKIIKDNLIPLVKTLSSEKNWRARLAVVEYLPKLSRDCSLQIYNEHIANLQNESLLDHYNTIRLQAISNFKELSEIYGYDNMKNQICKQLIELSNNSNYLYRICASQGLQELSNVMKEKDVQDIFDQLQKFTSDKVPNVRFNIIKCYAKIKDKLSQKQKTTMDKSINLLKKDQDQDVQQYAQDN